MLELKLNYQGHPNNQKQSTNKIFHQIENQGCKCKLCQRLILQKMKIIKNQIPPQLEEQLAIKGETQTYYIKYLTYFYNYDKMTRKIRLIIPQICVFEKGLPIYLMSKKKEINGLRVIKNKEKLNFYEIKNFFYEGYIFHNKSNDLKLSQNNYKGKSKQLATFQVKNKELLKNQCIVIARFTNNPGQILSPNMMDNLFKYSQKQFRSNLLYIQTLVCSKTYEQTRIKIKIQSLMKESLYLRAKNQIQIICNQIKSNQYGFISQKQQIQFEEQLKRSNWKKYLQYISIKLVLLHSFKSQDLIKQSIFKYVKAPGDIYYFVGLEVMQFGNKQTIWGITQKNIIQKRIQQIENLRKQQTQSNESKILGNRQKIIHSSYQQNREINSQIPAREKLVTANDIENNQHLEGNKIRKSFNIRKPTILGVNKQLLN